MTGWTEGAAGALADREMAYALPGEVEAYWHARRGERLMPLRSEIDPMGFEGALDNAFLIERTGHGHARLRLAGLWLTDAMGMEVRGMPFAALFDPSVRPALSEAVEEVFAGPSILRLSLAFGGRAPGAMLLLPLRSDLGDVSRALGCVGAPSMPDLARARFTISELERTDLLGTGTPTRELAETQTPYAPPKRAGHLRLVKG